MALDNLGHNVESHTQADDRLLIGTRGPIEAVKNLVALLAREAQAVFERVKPLLQDISPTINYVGGNGQMPPPSQLQGVGYNGSNIYGISIKSLVDQMLGAQHLTLFMVEFQPGGEGNVHDHPFEETYFFLSGEADALLDGKSYHVKAGDCVWTGVGSTHGFFNRGSGPVRWIETQSPQPPGKQAFRFPADWIYFAQKLGYEDTH